MHLLPAGALFFSNKVSNNVIRLLEPCLRLLPIPPVQGSQECKLLGDVERWLFFLLSVDPALACLILHLSEMAAAGEILSPVWEELMTSPLAGPSQFLCKLH